MCLQNLGYVALRQGDVRQATAYFRESLALNRTVGYQGGVAVCLEGLAAVAVARGRPEAARFFGAAEALREAIGARRDADPVYSSEYDRYSAAPRDQLDAAAWAMAWQAGRALAPEEVITAAQALP